MHILIAPNAFKHSLSAPDAARAIGEGLQQSKLDCTLGYFPVGDGGDGTAGLIIANNRGIIITENVHDALGRLIPAELGLADNGDTAVIELANASGLRLIHPRERNPLRATTFGAGELIKHALNRGATRIIAGIGGSATVDGGTGILQALGVRFLDKNAQELTGLPESLINLASIDLSGLDARILNCEFVILCDVENYLLGENGAAKIFGPQKGASATEVIKLEAALTRFRDVALAGSGKDMATITHGGAAGGVAAAMSVFCNAQLVNGIDHFLAITSFDAALEKADILITGEGSIDAQTLQGKAPYGVALRARQKHIPVIALAGKVPVESNKELEQYFDVLLSINHGPEGMQQALHFTERNLVRTAKALGNLLKMQTPGRKT